MKDDIAIEEIRRIRHEISAECGHDPMRLLGQLREEEKKYQEQINRYYELERQREQALILNDKPAKPSS